MKICKTCRKEKPLIEFEENLVNSDGLTKGCKNCLRRARRYRLRNPYKQTWEYRLAHHPSARASQKKK